MSETTETYQPEPAFLPTTQSWSALFLYQSYDITNSQDA